MKENWETHWKDYYQILQVDPSAEPEVIKAAHGKLALKYHPDINKEMSATQRMKDINEAYEILSNNEKRNRYHLAYLQRTGKGSSGDINNASTSAMPKHDVYPPEKRKSHKAKSLTITKNKKPDFTIGDVHNTNKNFYDRLKEK